MAVQYLAILALIKLNLNIDLLVCTKRTNAGICFDLEYVVSGLLVMYIHFQWIRGNPSNTTQSLPSYMRVTPHVIKGHPLICAPPELRDHGAFPVWCSAGCSSDVLPCWCAHSRAQSSAVG